MNLLDTYEASNALDEPALGLAALLVKYGVPSSDRLRELKRNYQVKRELTTPWVSTTV